MKIGKIISTFFIIIGVVLLLCFAGILILISSFRDIPPFDTGLERLMLIDAPDTLIYVSGNDTTLNFKEGMVRTYQNVYGYENNEMRLSYFKEDYEHDRVDFNKQGVYVITFRKEHLFSHDLYFQYTIQVISADEYITSPPIVEESYYWEDASSDYCENVTAIMTAPPHNIIYPVGYDGEIDLSGIVVKAAKGWFPKKYDIADLDYTLESDVDFNTPGSYIVKVYFTDDKGAERWFCFTVAVAEKVK